MHTNILTNLRRAHDYLKTIGVYLDNNHYVITAKRAGMLCKGFNGVPRHGWERKIDREGLSYYVGRTIHQGKSVWTARPTNDDWLMHNDD